MIPVLTILHLGGEAYILYQLICVHLQINYHWKKKLKRILC